MFWFQKFILRKYLIWMLLNLKSNLMESWASSFWKDFFEFAFSYRFPELSLVLIVELQELRKTVILLDLQRECK